jgi:hypothetical protein
MNIEQEYDNFKNEMVTFMREGVRNSRNGLGSNHDGHKIVDNFLYKFINFKDESGYTILHELLDMSDFCDPDIIEYIVSRGGDLTIQNVDGDTPLDIFFKGFQYYAANNKELKSYMNTFIKYAGAEFVEKVYNDHEDDVKDILERQGKEEDLVSKYIYKSKYQQASNSKKANMNSKALRVTAKAPFQGSVVDDTDIMITSFLRIPRLNSNKSKTKKRTSKNSKTKKSK